MTPLLAFRLKDCLETLRGKQPFAAAQVLPPPLNGDSDGAVDKYFFLDCLDPFLAGYHLRYQMTFPALSFFFSFPPRRRKGCKGALLAAGNQFIQSRVACRERWDRGSLI